MSQLTESHSKIEIHAQRIGIQRVSHFEVPIARACVEFRRRLWYERALVTSDPNSATTLARTQVLEERYLAGAASSL